MSLPHATARVWKGERKPNARVDAVRHDVRGGQNLGHATDVLLQRFRGGQHLHLIVFGGRIRTQAKGEKLRRKGKEWGKVTLSGLRHGR